jgi:hypothetical protein
LTCTVPSKACPTPAQRPLSRRHASVCASRARPPADAAPSIGGNGDPRHRAAARRPRGASTSTRSTQPARPRKRRRSSPARHARGAQAPRRIQMPAQRAWPARFVTARRGATPGCRWCRQNRNCSSLPR